MRNGSEAKASAIQPIRRRGVAGTIGIGGGRGGGGVVVAMIVLVGDREEGIVQFLLQIEAVLLPLPAIRHGRSFCVSLSSNISREVLSLSPLRLHQHKQLPPLFGLFRLMSTISY
jgi:hypothetical protein